MGSIRHPRQLPVFGFLVLISAAFGKPHLHHKNRFFHFFFLFSPIADAMDIDPSGKFYWRLTSLVKSTEFHRHARQGPRPTLLYIDSAGYCFLRVNKIHRECTWLSCIRQSRNFWGGKNFSIQFLNIYLCLSLSLYLFINKNPFPHSTLLFIYYCNTFKNIKLDFFCF